MYSPPELPPRARRILGLVYAKLLAEGTTSACAENTATNATLGRRQGNYLRVRGEYYRKTADHQPPGELPPRARRIPIHNQNASLVMGTTSACAENTGCGDGWGGRCGNYLRVRGEYAWACSVFCIAWELPPRARRIPRCLKIMALAVGTTSACAENTLNELGLL